MPVDITDQYIRVQQHPPGNYSEFRTSLLSEEQGISAVYGKKTGSEDWEIQTLLFAKEKWTEATVKQWIDKHNQFSWPGAQEILDEPQDYDSPTVQAEQDEVISPETLDGSKYIAIRQHAPAHFSSYQHQFLDKAKGIIRSVGKWKKTGATIVQKLLFERAKGWTEETVQQWFTDHPEYHYPSTTSGLFFALSDQTTDWTTITATEQALTLTPSLNPKTVFDVIPLRAGWGKNRRLGPDGQLYRDYFPQTFLESILPLLEGSAVQSIKLRPKEEITTKTLIPIIIKETVEELRRYGHPPQVLNMLLSQGLEGNTIGFLKNVRLETHHDTLIGDVMIDGPLLRAEFHLADTETAQQSLKLFQTAWQNGLRKSLGLSINYKADITFTQIDGERACIFQRATHHVSTEFVPNAAAGGMIVGIKGEQQPMATQNDTQPEDPKKTQDLQEEPEASPSVSAPADDGVVKPDEKPPVSQTHVPQTQAETTLVPVKESVPVLQTETPQPEPKTEMLQDEVNTLKEVMKTVIEGVHGMQQARQQEDLTKLVTESEISPEAKTPILEGIASRKLKTAEDVNAWIAVAQAQKQATQLEHAPVFPGLSGIRGSAEVLKDPKDVTKIRSLKNWGLPLTQEEQDLEKKYHIERFHGIQDEYIGYTGDTALAMNYDPNYFMARMHPELTRYGGWNPDGGSFAQAILTTTYTDFLTNIVNRTLNVHYNEQDKKWERIPYMGEPYTDNRDHQEKVLGQFGEISTVAEGGTYAEITTGALESVTSANIKKGNLFSISEETLQDDDLDYVKSAIQQIAYAANRTMFHNVIKMCIGYSTAFNDDTMTDSIAGALYSFANRANYIDGESNDWDKIKQLVNLMWTQVDLLDSGGSQAPLTIEPYLFIGEITQIGSVKSMVKNDRDPANDTIGNTLNLSYLPDENFIGVHPTFLWGHPEALIVMPNPQTFAGLKLSYFQGMQTPQFIWEGNQQPPYGQVFASDTLRLRIKFKYRLTYQRLKAFYGLFLS
jgi:hypothetical protein